MKKILSVFLVLGLLLRVGFATENSFDNQINNSISTLKQAFIAKKINQSQADLLSKLTIMSLIEKVAVAKIKAKSISDEDYLQALDKCDEMSDDITKKIISNLKKGNEESLKVFNDFVNGYKQKAGNILTCQNSCIENIKEFTSNKFNISHNIYFDKSRKIVHNPDGTWTNTDPGNSDHYTTWDAIHEGNHHYAEQGGHAGAAIGLLVGGYAGEPAAGAEAGHAIGTGVGAVFDGAQAIGSAVGHAVGSHESGEAAHLNTEHHASTNSASHGTTIHVVHKPPTSNNEDHPVIHVVHKPPTA